MEIIIMKGHSNALLEQITQHPNKEIDAAVIPIHGGRDVHSTRDLPPLALRKEEWRAIGARMGWDGFHILILPSSDGPEYTHAVLYPASWSPMRADREAAAAFAAAQKAAEPTDEWTWDDYEPELAKRGFMITRWHNGPAWDEGREVEN